MRNPKHNAVTGLAWKRDEEPRQEHEQEYGAPP